MVHWHSLFLILEPETPHNLGMSYCLGEEPEPYEAWLLLRLVFSNIYKVNIFACFAGNLIIQYRQTTSRKYFSTIYTFLWSYLYPFSCELAKCVIAVFMYKHICIYMYVSPALEVFNSQTNLEARYSQRPTHLSIYTHLNNMVTEDFLNSPFIVRPTE